ncbi:restriction endonuclease [Cellulomonas hominis]|uniref:nSTAND1 domain-containing NTPase n=1 Tax=Cellulomonas hominis TaxID=156981 RepID=UPI001443B1C1|nr:restriction endonuclease [Cellulomonas hominis]
MTTLKLKPAAILVLAEGDSPQAMANARGHLFETFVAKLLHSYGYEKPVSSTVNVTASGIELDVVTKTRLDGRLAIAECKAYARPVAAKEVTNFFGKLTMQRFTTPDALGLMMVLPGLTAEGREAAKSIEGRDKSFRYMDADAIAESLASEKLVSDPPIEADQLSDLAIVVSEHGIFSAALEIDEQTRAPRRVWAWAVKGPVPDPVIELLADDDYSQGLPVADARPGSPSVATEATADSEVVLVPVASSIEDFQYQLPAGPRFFVGRKTALMQLNDAILPGQSTIILNAQSGWGKSSLALKFAESIVSQGGSATVMDARTASSPRYIVEVLRRAIGEAAKAGVVTLPSELNWASLPSALDTLHAATWVEPRQPVLIFFDQFENVFQSETLTRAFRDLVLGAQSIEGPMIIGFAWKTDLVGWVEGYPYQLRDEIRSVARTIIVEPFGSAEVGTILSRLQSKAGVNLGIDLRTRLREYSQGLPWLLKKLADHVLRELRSGSSPEQLLAEALNIQSLFDADLAELGPPAVEILRHVARYAPIPAGEVTERYAPDAVQSLVDRRLIVQVGDRLDTYWDTFRDYLNSGRVLVEDSYILRLAPNQVARMLPIVMDNGGTSTVGELAKALTTSENVIFNLSRELRLLGIAVYEPLMVKMTAEIIAASDPEGVAIERVASALRRHKAYSALADIAARHDGYVNVEAFAAELPGLFPAVSARPGTWSSYARVFLSWFEYAGLASRQGNRYLVQTGMSRASTQRLLSARSAMRATRPGVPQVSPAASIAVLAKLGRGEAVTIPEDSGRARGAIRALASLGAVDVDGSGRVTLRSPQLVDSAGVVSPAELRRLLAAVPGGEDALERLLQEPGVRPAVIGQVIRQSIDAGWTESVTHSIGGYFRAWARLAGVPVVRPPRGSASGLGAA